MCECSHFFGSTRNKKNKEFSSEKRHPIWLFFHLLIYFFSFLVFKHTDNLKTEKRHKILQDDEAKEKINTKYVNSFSIKQNEDDANV